MTAARPGASRPGATGYLRISLALLLAIGLSAFCSAIGLATAAAPAQAQTSSRSQAPACGVSRGSVSPSPRVATGSKAVPLLAVGSWLGARAATALAEKGFLTGLEAIMRAAGHQNPAEQTLEQLDEIRGHLNEVSAQLSRVEGRLDGIASAINSHAFDADLRPLCAIARQQHSLFTEFYEPLIRAGYRLAETVKNDPKGADTPGDNGLTPRQEVQELLSVYLERSRLRDDEGDFQTLREALVPTGQGTPILQSYGRVLLGKRFLTRADSNSIRVLYRELAAVRAIATWMSEEYWSSRPAFGHLVRQRQHAMVNDNTVEENSLPRMIPEGVVIDLGTGGSTGTTGKPMWYPPAERDLGWLPPVTVGAAFGSTIRVTEVEQRLEQVNNSHFRPEFELGTGWAVPTKQQAEALLSEGCVADPADPTKFRGGVKCTSAVKPSTGGTVGGYLGRLDPNDRVWRRLFCTAGCAPFTGPSASDFRHSFIWTNNTHTEHLVCGRKPEFLKSTFYRRAVPSYTGFSTTTSSLVWHAYPQFLENPPRRGVEAQESFDLCDSWIRTLVREAPARNIALRGVLLATRYAGAQDLNPVSHIDYMAQR